VTTEIVARPLTRAQARKLTDRIQHHAEEAWGLLQTARNGRAWDALGYASWEAYVGEEFGMSRSESYRLLDQAKVITELSAAAGVPVAVSARQAAAVKPELERAKDEVAAAVARKPRRARAAIAADVVADIVKPDTRPAPPPLPSSPPPLPAAAPAPTQPVDDVDGADGEFDTPARRQQAAQVLPRIFRLSPQGVLAEVPDAERLALVDAAERWAMKLRLAYNQDEAKRTFGRGRLRA